MWFLNKFGTIYLHDTQNVLDLRGKKLERKENSNQVNNYFLKKPFDFCETIHLILENAEREARVRRIAANMTRDTWVIQVVSILIQSILFMYINRLFNFKFTENGEKNVKNLLATNGKHDSYYRRRRIKSNARMIVYTQWYHINRREALLFHGLSLSCQYEWVIENCSIISAVKSKKQKRNTCIHCIINIQKDKLNFLVWRNHSIVYKVWLHVHFVQYLR